MSQPPSLTPSPPRAAVLVNRRRTHGNTELLLTAMFRQFTIGGDKFVIECRRQNGSSIAIGRPLSESLRGQTEAVRYPVLRGQTADRCTIPNRSFRRIS